MSTGDAPRSEPAGPDEAIARPWGRSRLRVDVVVSSVVALVASLLGAVVGGVITAASTSQVIAADRDLSEQDTRMRIYAEFLLSADLASRAFADFTKCFFAHELRGPDEVVSDPKAEPLTVVLVVGKVADYE